MTRSCAKICRSHVACSSRHPLEHLENICERMRQIMGAKRHGKNTHSVGLTKELHLWWIEEVSLTQTYLVRCGPQPPASGSLAIAHRQP
jgi:hypothetical protein